MVTTIKRGMMKRFWKRVWLRILIWNKRAMKGSGHVRRPVCKSADVDTALRIWSRVVMNGESELMYNPVTQECYAEWFDKSNPVYLFLESGRMRIVNTVIGYDVQMTMDEENWCSELFRREVNRRRNTFKTEALGKVVHSLDDLESRLINGEKG